MTKVNIFCLFIYYHCIVLIILFKLQIEAMIMDSDFFSLAFFFYVEHFLLGSRWSTGYKSSLNLHKQGFFFF